MFEFNPKTTSHSIADFIRSTLKRTAYKKVLVAVSGGIDSATTLILAVQALGMEWVHPVLLPYGKLSNESTEDAWLIINTLTIPHKQVTCIDIQPYVDNFIQYDRSIDTIRSGNIMARMRMLVLFDLANKNKCLVIGTENKTEHLLGYYTRFGDEASDIEPLRTLYKTQVYMLAKYLNIPEKILTKSPTAGLWEGQTDESEFGFSYKIADEILYFLIEKKLSKKELIAHGYDKETIEKIWWWRQRGIFKERLPYVYKDLA